MQQDEVLMREETSAFYAFWRGPRPLVIRFQLRMQHAETGGNLQSHSIDWFDKCIGNDRCCMASVLVRITRSAYHDKLMPYLTISDKNDEIMKMVLCALVIRAAKLVEGGQRRSRTRRSDVGPFSMAVTGVDVPGKISLKSQFS